MESSGERVTWNTNTPVTASAAGIVIGKKSFGPRLVLEAVGTGNSVLVNSRPYRGRVELLCNAQGQVTVVNALPVNDYVRGILVRETSPRWPREALKAQAVISRTYALKNRGRHGSQGFDYCDEAHCQVYGGRAAEHDVTNAAVESTRNEVLLYNREVISSVFHSCCGGSTDGAENIWEKGGAPYLRAVRCGWCRGSPRYHWTSDADETTLSSRLKAAGYNIGDVKDVRVLSKSRSGRAYMVRVIGLKGHADLSGNKFRLMTDGRAIRSTLWSGLSRTSRGWRFHGNGWGHGVGLCQWGAKAMADRGYKYTQILRFYYKGVSLGRMRG
jgi:stage II sporulation protein D